MSNRSSRLLSTGLSLIALVVASILFFSEPLLRQYAVSRVEAAKWQGKFDSPEDGMRALVAAEYEAVERVDIESAGPANRDGSAPHVWYVTARVYAPTRGDGKPIPPGDYDNPGSYFLRVDGEWVHLREGALPKLVGSIMARYGLYGCDPFGSNCR